MQLPGWMEQPLLLSWPVLPQDLAAVRWQDEPQHRQAQILHINIAYSKGSLLTIVRIASVIVGFFVDQLDQLILDA